jgi:hypothetical protein
VPDETPSSRGAAPPPSSPRPPAPAPTRGRLIVNSTPSRAGVTIDGTWRGRTPLTLDDLAFGRHVVRVVQPGYAVAREDISLGTANPSQEVDLRLERTAPAAPQRPAPRAETPAPRPTQPLTGSLYVDSRPRGATVVLDGRSIGQTPLSVPEVPIGAHVVRLEMAGKRVWTSSTRVVAGEIARVTGSLEDIR